VHSRYLLDTSSNVPSFFGDHALDNDGKSAANSYIPHTNRPCFSSAGQSAHDLSDLHCCKIILLIVTVPHSEKFESLKMLGTVVHCAIIKE
jgi:hypothetical protein